MALSEFEIKRVDKLLTAYCEGKVPAHLRDQIRIEYRIRGNEVSLFESRPHLQGSGEWFSMKVARFKKDTQTGTWLLFWADRNSKWQPYPPLPFHRDIEKLLQEVEKNETGAFWG
jgi:hypothetical protein